VIMLVLGWVGMSPNFPTSSELGLGLDPLADGLGWIGSHKMDPWTTLSQLDGQHQDVDKTPGGRVNQNDRGQR